MVIAGNVKVAADLASRSSAGVASERVSTEVSSDTRASTPGPLLDTSSVHANPGRRSRHPEAGEACYCTDRQLSTTAVTASSEVAISVVNRASPTSEGPIVTSRDPTWA